MRKFLTILFVLVLFGIDRLSAQQVILAPTNGTSICCGYSKFNLARVCIVSPPPLIVADNVGLVYTWYAQHEKGFWRWHTPMNYRYIPLPWAGAYNVWVEMSYVDKRTVTVYAVYRSNVVQIQGRNCTAKEPDGGDPSSTVSSN